MFHLKSYSKISIRIGHEYLTIESTNLFWSILFSGAVDLLRLFLRFCGNKFLQVNLEIPCVVKTGIDSYTQYNAWNEDDCFYGGHSRPADFQTYSQEGGKLYLVESCLTPSKFLKTLLKVNGAFVKNKSDLEECLALINNPPNF
jgi:hypothetical protein